MNKSITLFLMLLAFLSSCSSQPALDQAGTMVAQTVAAAPPTNTPQPALTSSPTGTSSPKPTATSNIALTTTVEAFHVLSELDVQVGSNSGIPYQTGYLAWQQNEPNIVDLSGPMEAIQEIDEQFSAENFVLKSDITWNATGILVCGLIFRSEADLQRGEQYQFLYLRLSGLPAWAIEVHKFGRFKNSPTGIKFSDALNLDSKAKNQIVLIVQDNEFTLVINNKRQGAYFDESRQISKGSFGFIGSQDSGKGSCTFEDSWIWVLE